MPQQIKGNQPNNSVRRIFFVNFIGGIGWVLGMTLGVSLLVLITSSIISSLGGLPIIGGWIAKIIAVTQQALSKHNPSIPINSL